MLAITIAVTSTVGSSNIINRTDQRALVVESARSAIDIIRQQSLKMSPGLTQVANDGNGLIIGQYSPDVQQNVCMLMGKGKPTSTTDLMGDAYGGSVGINTNGFKVPDSVVDDFDFQVVVLNYGDNKTAELKILNDAALAISGGITIDPTRLPTDDNTYFPTSQTNYKMSYWRSNYTWNPIKKLFRYKGDTNDDGVINDSDFANVVLNFGSTPSSGSAQKYSFDNSGTVLMMFAYQLRNGCQIKRADDPHSKNTTVLYFGPLHDPEKVITKEISVSKTNDKTVGLSEKYMIRIKLVMEESGIKQSNNAQDKRSEIELLTGIPMGLNQ